MQIKCASNLTIFNSFKMLTYLIYAVTGICFKLLHIQTKDEPYNIDFYLQFKLKYKTIVVYLI